MKNWVRIVKKKKERKVEDGYRQSNTGLEPAVYSPLVYNRPDDNWLLDIELYSEEFRADLISIWMDEMGLASNPAMRKQVKIIVPISMRKTVV